MTAHIGTTSIDGTPISEADLARIEAEEKLHEHQQRQAVRVVAACANDAEDCRLLLSVLGLDGAVAEEARTELAAARAAAPAAPVKRARKRRAA
jgi:hypothetical protein